MTFIVNKLFETFQLRKLEPTLVCQVVCQKEYWKNYCMFILLFMFEFEPNHMHVKVSR